MLVSTFIALCLVAGCLATNPGAKIRVSQSGLNYGATVAVDILSAAAQKLSIPDVRGRANIGIGDVEYQVTNIRVTGFQRPSTDVDEGTGTLTWSCRNAAIWLHGDWHYKLHAAFIPVSDSGNFDGDTSGVSVGVTVQLGMEGGTGRPSIASTGCNAHVSDIHVKMHGGASWLYNLFIDKVIAPVRGELERLLCDEARKAVDHDAERELSTLPVQVEIDHAWELDYRLVSAPLLQPGFLETALKGEFFAKGDTTEAPFEPAALPSPSTARGMVTVWLSDYILNTAGYALYKRGILRHNLTAAELPPKDRVFLDVTCHFPAMCIGGAVPAIKKLYPNATIELEMAADDSPKAEISAAEIGGALVGRITYYARLADGSSKYLFCTSVKAVVALTAQLDNMVVKGKLTKLTPTLVVTDSAIGPIPSAGLDWIFSAVSKSFIMPKLNEVGEKGFAIPVIKHVKFINTQLILEPHALQISTDVQYA